LKTFDVIVVGAGPGGYVAAIRAAQLGLSVAIVEREHMGGICLNWGCIPTKTMLRSSEVFHLMQRAGEFGLSATGIDFDLEAVIKRSRAVAKQLNSGVSHLMKKNKITVVMGEATLPARGKVRVTTDKGTEDLSADNIIVATGARARELPGLEADGDLVWTYKHALMPPRMPKKLLVIGSGAIGIEFASFYNTLGAETTVVEVQDRILPVEDAEISAFARKSFEAQKMTIRTNSTVKKLDRGKGRVTAHIETDGKVQKHEFDTVISAVGHHRQYRRSRAGGSGRQARPQFRGDGCVLPDRCRWPLRDRRRHAGPVACAQGQPRGRDGGRDDRRRQTACRGPRQHRRLHLLPATDRQRRPDRGAGAGCGL